MVETKLTGAEFSVLNDLDDLIAAPTVAGRSPARGT